MGHYLEIQVHIWRKPKYYIDDLALTTAMLSLICIAYCFEIYRLEARVALTSAIMFSLVGMRGVIDEKSPKLDHNNMIQKNVNRAMVIVVMASLESAIMFMLCRFEAEIRVDADELPVMYFVLRQVD